MIYLIIYIISLILYWFLLRLNTIYDTPIGWDDRSIGIILLLMIIPIVNSLMCFVFIFIASGHFIQYKWKFKFNYKKFLMIK